MPVQTLWNSRLDWSGEVPLDYPGLNLLTLTRFHEVADYQQGPAYEEVADTGNSANWRMWYENGGAGNAFTEAGQWGEGIRLNSVDPAVSQSWVGRGGGGQLPPQGMTSGRYLVGMWYDHAFTMAHIPLITTRGGTGLPLFHLATVNYGSLRHQVYDGSGGLLLDKFEGEPPWGPVFTSQWIGQLIDFDAGTSQLLAADFGSRQWWAAPARAIGGTPNSAPDGQIRVFGMGSIGYWAGGGVDEFLTARPDASFDAEEFLERLVRGTHSTAQAGGHGSVLTVTDSEVTGPVGGSGGSERTFHTGAVPLRWQDAPTFSPLAGYSHGWAAEGSTDGGESWSDLSDPPPAAFDGLVRFRVYLANDSASFAGMNVDIADVGAPVVESIAPVTIGEGTSTEVEVSSSDGWRPVTFSASSSDAAVAAVSMSGSTLTIDGGVPGSATVTVVATDADGQTGEATFDVTVEVIAPDPPVIDPIDGFDLEAGTAEAVTLSASGQGTPFSWSAVVVGDPDGLVSVDVVGDQLTVGAGFGEGAASLDVTVTDSYLQADTVSVPVAVSLPPTPPVDIPRYAREPIIVGDGADAVAIIDPVSGVVVREVNGEHTIEFSIAAKHRHGGAIRPERAVEHAGIPYRVRRIETGREAGTPVLLVYCEEEFYDLAYAGQIDAREYQQVSALDALGDAVAGTGWSVGTVNVSTRRTYAVEDTTPLELLRTVQENHGGDLVFDSVARSVSLVTRSGRDAGVAFLYGRGLTQSKRVVDTTSLVTRIYARNADGQTIASVNGGKPYVEDFTWTGEVREATYDFAAGTSPYTMLSTVSATLANRSKPSYSYEFTVADLSWRTGQEVDRFDTGDLVTVVDDELGIRETQRIVRVEHDIVRPSQTKITLSAKLRELGSSSSDEGDATTGSGSQTFDLVPFNLLKNSRFDGGLQHWGSMGVEVVENGQGTGDFSARFAGSGERWIEQTVQPDNRDSFSLSLDVASSGPQGWTPDVRAIAEVTYEDGSSETIVLELTS